METRTPAPGGQDIIQYAQYDTSGRPVLASVPYFVASYSGGPGAAAFATPDTTTPQPTTQTTYDGLGRMTGVQNPLGQVTTTSYVLACGWAPFDPACYEAALVHDALMHQTYTLTDALGRVGYRTVDTGNGTSPSPWAFYAETYSTYDALGRLVKIIQPDGSATTVSYDAAGRTTAMSDPDRGTESYAYDANGNVTQTSDARGSAGTIYAGYDGLNRQTWRNTSNSGSGAYVSYSYDSTASGNQGVGRLTGETFSGALGSGSYSYTYDPRGQTTASTLSLGTSSYPVGTSYNDAGQALVLTYPTGESVTAGYSAAGWLGSLTRTLAGGGATTTLLGAISYSGSGGASGQRTSAQVGNGTYGYSASFDALARPAEVTTTRSSDGATLFAEAPSYDAVGNISGETLTLPSGTDVQRFCYDDLNRLTWAGSVGTPPCAGTAITPGSLSGAQYRQTFGYGTLNRLTTGPLGDYTYGDSAHLHAATSVDYYGTTSYSARYDASGNMVCRAPTSSVTCAGGANTGQQLTWDNEGRLVAWQNAPTSPTATDQYLYDGEGNRVEQQVTSDSGGATTTTTYVGALESVATTGGSTPTTTTTTYYYAAGQRIALAVNGTLSYLASDLLGSATVALDANGTPTASQLYAPYGGVRYANGVMPTDYGFTGQRADASTGLDYYGARYYDSTLGQFASADTVNDGLNRYGYVGGNPISHTDPSGHRTCVASCDGNEVSERSPEQWAASYYTLAMTQPGAALTMALWSPSAWAQALAYAYYTEHSNDLLLVVGQQAFAYRQGRPSNAWNASPAMMREYGVLTGFMIQYLVATGGGSVQDSSLDIRATGFPTLLMPRVTEPNEAPLSKPLNDGGGVCSFAADTQVATPDGGEQAIGTLQVGDQVTAYDPATGKSSTQTVQHVWLNHDNDLLDVTLRQDQATARTSAPSKTQPVDTKAHGSQAPPSDETIHTTEKHPWLTTDRGWVKAGDLRVGEQVVELGGRTATITALAARPGAADYYNLSVSQLHTYAVGSDQFVVHNVGCGNFESPPLSINGKQFGAKVGKHAQDFGLDPADPAARDQLRDIIINIHGNPDEIRQGPWNPKGGGGSDYLFY